MRACPMSDIEFTKLVVGFHVTSVHSILVAVLTGQPPRSRTARGGVPRRPADRQDGDILIAPCR